MARRILLFSHDAVGLGHIRRVSAIAERLADEDPRSTLLVLTGSSTADVHSLPDNVDIVKLPGLRKVNNARYESRRLRVDQETIIRLRRGLIQSTLARFAPDLFIVDKTPLGVHGELRPALETMKSLGGRVVLSLRDILDEPDTVLPNWNRDGSLDALRTFYDRILVWGSRQVYDLVSEYRLPQDVAAKIEYCGYITRADRSALAPVRRPANKRLVLVTVGGGEDGFPLLRDYLRALPDTEQSFASVLVFGPDLPEEHVGKLRRLISDCGRPVFAIDYTRHMGRLMAAADLVVCMGGYNTMCEVVSSGRRAIVVPRTHPRTEQLIRARRMEELGLVRVVTGRRSRPHILARAVDEELDTPRAAAVPPLDFRGLDHAVEVLKADETRAARIDAATEVAG